MINPVDKLFSQVGANKIKKKSLKERNHRKNKIFKKQSEIDIKNQNYAEIKEEENSQNKVIGFEKDLIEENGTYEREKFSLLKVPDICGNSIRSIKSESDSNEYY